MSRAVLISALLLRVACASAHPIAPGERSVDGGVTGTGGASRPTRPRPQGGFCEGVNFANDDHFDPAFMGGPLVGWNWIPASDLIITHVEIYTGEQPGSSQISIWSDSGGSPGQPGTSLGYSNPFSTDLPNAWYGADLLTPVPVTAGTTYWVVWDPVGGEQVSASDDVADVQTTYWGSNSGTVAGGASWFGPFTFPDRRWKARMKCGGIVSCEDPTFTTASAVDVSDCNDGIVLTWDPATFPGAGNGAYHVYRSPTDFVDALARPPIAQDVRGGTLVDGGTAPGGTYWYVVQAESLDFPGCGVGPLATGSTANVDVGPVEDLGDIAAPTGTVGGALRATGYGAASVDFQWLLAAAPGLDEQYAVFRSDGRADLGFAEIDRTLAQVWTDPAVPPRPEAVHVWFYDVRLVDACGNASDD